MTHITPTEHEKSEWARMGAAALDAGYNAVAHLYGVASHLPSGERMSVAYFDELQGCYRSWLCFNDFKAADCTCQPQTYSEHHLVSFAPL